jgi:hypothetical protein
MPSANGRLTAASTALMQFSGARKPRVWRATLFLNSAKISGLPRAGAILSSRSRIFLSGRFSASAVSANATPAAVRSPSTISSIKPTRSASSAPIGSPLTIIWRAFCGPTTLGSRCVPPAPGRRPSFTSGRPKRAPFTPTR